MFKEFFGGKRGYVVDENGVPQKKRRSAVLIVIAAAVLILALSGRGTEKPKKSAETAPNTEFDIAAYTRETEQRLAGMISEINGAGRVEVMVAFDTAYEKVIAKNEKNGRTTSADGEKTANESQNEASIQVFGTGNAQQPYVLKEKLPVPSGVAVAATGAGDEKVRLEIYEAVKALYGISGNRIKVTVGKRAESK